ncbi:MAG TPA: urease accessory protein UreD [Eoetvoesiella sp.]
MFALANDWHAKLELSFERQGTNKTVLARRKHEGPLLVQKALYPEGAEVCHVTILHPPSGIAGGDVLQINIDVKQDAHALLTTPGATRWYKANGRRSAQTVIVNLAANARLDWLPHENIFFEQANAAITTQINMHTGASNIGWEITQLGSITKKNHWDEGLVLLNTQLTLNQRPLWLDVGELCATSPLRTSVNGLDGFPVLATLWAFGPGLTSEQTDVLAETLPWDNTVRAGLTYMPQANEQGLSLIRVLGQHVEDVKRLLIELWTLLRPLVQKKEGTYLRIWNT